MTFWENKDQRFHHPEIKRRSKWIVFTLSTISSQTRGSLMTWASKSANFSSTDIRLSDSNSSNNFYFCMLFSCRRLQRLFAWIIQLYFKLKQIFAVSLNKSSHTIGVRIKSFDYMQIARMRIESISSRDES